MNATSYFAWHNWAVGLLELCRVGRCVNCVLHLHCLSLVLCNFVSAPPPPNTEALCHPPPPPNLGKQQARVQNGQKSDFRRGGSDLAKILVDVGVKDSDTKYLQETQWWLPGPDDASGGPRFQNLSKMANKCPFLSNLDGFSKNHSKSFGVLKSLVFFAILSYLSAISPLVGPILLVYLMFPPHQLGSNIQP